MSNRTLHELSTIFGTMGRAYITIDGRREELFYATDIEANIEKNKVELKMLGCTGTKHRAAGWSGNGSMTIYYCTTLYRRMMAKYTRTGEDTYFDLLVENEDTGSKLGKQTVLLKGCNFDSMMVAKVSTEDDILYEDLGFTFNGYEILEDFNSITVE